MPHGDSNPTPALPPIDARVRITCGGYSNDHARVTDVYQRNGRWVVEVYTDSYIPLLYSPLDLEIVAYPVVVAPVHVAELASVGA